MASPPPPSAVAQRCVAAAQALQAGAPQQALLLLRPAIETAPRFGPARRLQGLALARLGDRAAAEAALRLGAALDKRDPDAHVVLADFLAEGGETAEAERAYRTALTLDRRWPPAVLGLAQLLLWAGRPAEAAQATLPLAAAAKASPEVLSLHTQALVGAGRLEEALTFSRRAAAAGAPDADLGSAQLAADLGRFGEAEAQFRAILTRDPRDERARRGLARAVFAVSGAPEAALAVVDEGLTRQWSPTLAGFKATLLNQAFRPAEAYAVLQEAVERRPDDPALQAAAATAAALGRRPEAALAHAERAASLAPGNDDIAVLLAEARLCAGLAERALELLEPLRRQAPLDQKRIALIAVAQRMLGDDRRRAIYDYSRFVRSYAIEPPRGWGSVTDFLAALKTRLHQIHDGQGATLDQSVRGGTQTNVNLVGSREPLIQALFSALERPIADYVADLGRSDDPLADPLRARNQGGFAFGGAWSVRLNPGAGHHVDHIHAEGWLSSAFYVDLPQVMRDGAGEEGWIQFGQPNLPTDPPLPAEHKVRPEPGRLVLFPSYVWHGTLPFSGTEPRLTFAFDVVPAPGRG